ncbi:hypothetical protein THC_0240 [Caldimicrobium thiodismutans]|jgi:hypothetical protein|uniref:Uncharacterized protein n=1 Tax=Caldimicrobium thiodismutans TaxID=1653476 RepID=A0A0U5B3N5_9BACT|nr:hypothetical protein [Caldimicrobium thiodismutans]BAU22640.1 hypothetical protein THC_0240 [Caldimicrobium thiodismutans]
MQEKDMILTLKDWIKSFWELQEDDIRFFLEDFKELMRDPKALLDELKFRMKRRRAFYNIFKHLSWRDLPVKELDWVQQKMDELLARESLITETVNKILNIMSEVFFDDELEEIKKAKKILEEDRIIYH